MLTQNQVNTAVNTILNNDICMISADTGTGKSSKIPPLLSHKGYNVIVAVPTRVSAISLAKYANEIISNQKLNVTVDYKIRGKSLAKIPTLLYATSKIVLNQIYSIFEEGIPKKTKNLVLIIDEVHTGNLDYSIIINLFKYIMLTKVGAPKLALMTATPIPIPGFPAITTLKLETERISSILGREEITYVGDYKGNSLINKMRDVIIEIHKNKNDKYHIIAFVPGIEKLRSLFNAIELLNLRNIILIQVYREMEDEKYRKLIEPAPKGFRKIVIATNVEESSITVPDVGYIVDSMLENRPGKGVFGESVSINEVNISKNSSKQRMGRAGRTVNVKEYYAMISEKKYKLLENERPLDINLISIHKEIIVIIGNNINPIFLLRDNFKGREAELKEAIKDLEKYGMIFIESQNGIDNYFVTEKGQFASEVPLGILSSSFLWHWIKTMKGPGIIGALISSIIDTNNRNIFKIPYDLNNRDKTKEKREYIEKNFGRYMGYDSFTTIIQLWYKIMIEFPDIFVSYKYLSQVKKWSINNNINQKNVEDIIYSVYSILEIMKEIGDIDMKSVMTSSEAIKYSIACFNSSHKDFFLIPKEGGYITKNKKIIKIDDRGIPYKNTGTGMDPLRSISLIEIGNKSKINISSLFTHANYREERYFNSKFLIYKPIYLQEVSGIMKKTEKNTIQDKFDSSLDRIPLVTPESIGYSSNSLYVPKVLRPSFIFLEYDENIELRTYPLSMLPEFIKTEKIKPPKTKETYLSELDKEIEEDLKFGISKNFYSWGDVETNEIGNEYVDIGGYEGQGEHIENLYLNYEGKIDKIISVQVEY